MTIDSAINEVATDLTVAGEQMTRYLRGVYYAFFYPYRVHAFLKLLGMCISESEHGAETMRDVRRNVSFYAKETWG